MKTILLTGGSGFIGTELAKALVNKGYKVIIASTNPPQNGPDGVVFEKIDLTHEAIPKKYEGEIYGIVNLAGKNMFGRWTEKFKKALYCSRIESTKKIIETLSDWKIKPHVCVFASAFGYYGNRGDEKIDETAKPGNDFLANVCADWEAEAQKGEKLGIRTVEIRTGHVLGKQGLLAPLFLPFKLGLGDWIGKGNGWFPWIHIDDIFAIYVFAIENENLSGPINAASTEYIRQKEFMKLFGDIMGRKVLFSIPIFILSLFYGALADTFKNSVKMDIKKLLDAGFIFKHPFLKEAFESILR